MRTALFAPTPLPLCSARGCGSLRLTPSLLPEPSQPCRRPVPSTGDPSLCSACGTPSITLPTLQLFTILPHQTLCFASSNNVFWSSTQCWAHSRHSINVCEEEDSHRLKKQARKGRGICPGHKESWGATEHGEINVGRGRLGGWREERSRESQLPGCVTPVSNTLSVPCLE